MGRILYGRACFLCYFVSRTCEFYLCCNTWFKAFHFEASDANCDRTEWPNAADSFFLF